MPTDTKIGLLVGLGLVAVIAVLFFQRSQPVEPLDYQPYTHTLVESSPPVFTKPILNTSREPISGVPVSRGLEERE
ncbi:MAG: hypothetical protein N2112_01245 [Gemmataceae bacterium]|jgi:hypothetical protein|nr:hypothetical protein [Gemmataceae bacterium]